MSDHPLYRLPETREMQRVADWLARWQWSEGKGGNFSQRLEAVPPELEARPEAEARPLPVAAPALAGAYLLVTGSRTRARDLAEAPHEALGLFRIEAGGQAYRYVCGHPQPTSELPSHAAIHQALAEVRPEHRAVLHTHPPRLIAVTHLPEFADGRRMSDVLLRMQSEAALLLPEGVAHLPYYLPGSLELGLASAEAVREASVVLWHLHGALATGPTLADALDSLEYLDKAAEVYWLLRAAGVEPQGLGTAQLRRALEQFGRLGRSRRWLADEGNG